MDELISIDSSCPLLEKLKLELTTPHRDFDRNGRVMVESKKTSQNARYRHQTLLTHSLWPSRQLIHRWISGNSWETGLMARNKQALRRTAQATADGYENFIARVGMQTPNQHSASTYRANFTSRNRMLVEWSYRSSWIIGEAVDAIPDDMTRKAFASLRKLMQRAWHSRITTG